MLPKLHEQPRKQSKRQRTLLLRFADHGNARKHRRPEEKLDGNDNNHNHNHDIWHWEKRLNTEKSTENRTAEQRQ